MFPLVGVRPGEVIAGKYRVDGLLGSGGMGVVLAGHHVELDERVAIKVLLPEYTQVEAARARFAREARAAVKVKSEHMAKVLDAGHLDNGAPYMVMEFLEGKDLAACIRETGTYSVEAAVGLVLQACEAIAEAHALGIVHRDLKPSNLFVTRRPDGSPWVKVLDFGISKMVDSLRLENGGQMTKTSEMMGSPLYMSPEQMRSTKDADARADVWSLGVILYELVCKQYPFSAHSLPDLVLGITQDAPVPLSQRVRVPLAFEHAVFRCLEKDRDRRYANIYEFAAAMQPFGPPSARGSLERIAAFVQTGVAGVPSSGSVPPAITPTTDPSVVVADTKASWGRTGTSARTSRNLVLAGGFTLIVGVSAWSFTRSDTGSVVTGSAGARSSISPALPSIAPELAMRSSSPAVTSSAFAGAAATGAPNLSASPSATGSVPAAPHPIGTRLRAGSATGAKPTRSASTPALPASPPDSNVFDSRK